MSYSLYSGGWGLPNPRRQSISSAVLAGVRCRPNQIDRVLLTAICFVWHSRREKNGRPEKVRQMTRVAKTGRGEDARQKGTHRFEPWPLPCTPPPPQPPPAARRSPPPSAPGAASSPPSCPAPSAGPPPRCCAPLASLSARPRPAARRQLRKPGNKSARGQSRGKKEEQALGV